jgi:hypothetical protein
MLDLDHRADHQRPAHGDTGEQKSQLVAANRLVHAVGARAGGVLTSRAGGGTAGGDQMSR